MSLPKLIQKILNNYGYGTNLTGNDNDVVHKTGDEVIEGVKEFKNAAALTPEISDNSTKIATTEFVKAQGYLTSVSGTAGTSLLAWDTENTVYTVGGHAIKVKLPANPNTNWTSHLYAGASNGNTNAATTNGNTYLIICDNTTARDRRLIKGTGATTVTSDSSGNIIINSTDNNTVYTHPTTSGNKHIPSGGSSGQILRWSSDGTAAWGADNNTTYSVSTTGSGNAVTAVSLSGTTITATKGASYITSSGSITGTAANVTGTVAIANGGTGATTRLNAIKALTNENVGTNATHFLGLKSDWSKVGYVGVADVKTVLGLGTAAYTASTAYAAASHTHSYVAKSGDTMTGNLVIKKNGPEFHLRSDEITYSSTVSANKYMNLYFRDSGNNYLARLMYYKNSGSAHEIGFEMGMCDHNSTDLNVVFKGKMNTSYKTAIVGSVFQYFRSDGKNTCALGSSDYKWSNVYATTTSIGSSDERMKCDITLIPDEVLDLWETIPFKQFKFKHAVKDKGSNARFHTGMIAQDIKRVFEANNMNPGVYGLFCYDEWEETPEVLHDDGTMCQEYQPAGSEYALRYAELLCMEAAYNRRRVSRVEERLLALEQELAELKKNS